MNRRKSNWVLFSFVTVIAFNLILGMGQKTQAADAKALLKQIGRELRQAERDMFAGKTDKAISAFEPIKKRLIELKAADPNNPGLKTVENKYKKLVKDLERRTGKDLGGGTLTTAETSIRTTLSPKPEAKAIAPKKLPRDAGKTFGEARAVAASSKEIDADVKALLDEYKRVEPLFTNTSGNVMYYYDLDPVKKRLTQIENFEKNDLDKINGEMKTFAQKYGSKREEIDRKAEAMGYSGQIRASFPYTALSEGILNVQKTRTVMADDLIRRASDMKDQTSRGISDFARQKQYKRIKAWGELAAQLDQYNPRVKKFNTGLDSWIEEDMKALNTKIDKVTWPGYADDVPGDADKLSEIAVEFLQKEENKRAEKNIEAGKVLAVVITGPWRVFRKNLLGEPIQYYLPIICAVEYESDKGLNVARVYNSTLLTENYRGVKMAPPFLGATVGNSYFIRPSAIK